MLEEKMEKIRTAVLVSGGGTNLQALLDKQGTEILDGEIVLVLSNNANAYALERAKKAGVSTAVVVKKELGSQEAFENAMLAVLAEYKVDFIVMAGFLTILSENFTNAYKNRIINVHPSLIPKYAGEGFYGLKVHEAVLAAGEKVTGATVHFVNEIPDGGEIILQKEVAVEPGDTPESLQKRVMEAAEWILLPKAVQTVCERMRKGEKR
jgi:phosphoribosylglycinamide formyltransferase-1